MPAEPTSQWERELQSSVSQLQASVATGLDSLNKKADDAKRGIDAVNQRLDDPRVGIFKLISDLKGDVGGVKTDVAGLSGVKLFVGGVAALVTVVVLVAGANTALTLQLNSTMFGFKGDIASAKTAGDVAKVAADSAKASADSVAAENARLRTTIGTVETSFKGMDQELKKRMQEFDAKLNMLGEKIAELDKAAASKQKLDEIQAKVNAIDAKLENVRPAIAIPARRTARVTELRSLHVNDRQPDAPPQQIVFSLKTPEGLDPSLVEEVSATFPTATIQRPGSFVTVTTRLDPKTGQLFISIVGVQEETIKTLLDSPDGLRVSIIYIIRESGAAIEGAKS